jgi:phosphoglycolate phosphatase
MTEHTLVDVEPHENQNNKQKLRVIVLDYDQTLVDNTVDFYEAYCGAMRYYGTSCLLFNDFLKLLRTNNLDRAIPRGVSPEEFFRVFRGLYLSRHSSLQPGVREFLVLVKAFNVKIIVVSGRETPSWYIVWDLNRHGLMEFIDDVLTLNDRTRLGLEENFLFDKSGLIKYALGKHGVSGGVVCIGDYVTDYYSCKSIGGVFIGLNKYSERNSELEKAGVKMLARDFHEVLVLLSQNGFLA